MNTKTKYKILIALLIVVIILNWATISELVKNSNNSVTDRNVEELPQIYNETTVASEIYFCPQDECLDEMLLWLDAAEEYIHCAIFEVGLLELQEKMFQRSEEIEVKLITDDNYYDEVKHLDFAMHDNRSGLMHNKFCILDGKAVWTGSFNPTERGNYKNNNNVVFYQSQYLAENYEKEFQEMWGGLFGKGERNEKTEFIINGKRIENYFCPEDWCANKVIYALQDAEKSIYFMTFSFTHDDIGEQVLERAADGVEVRGVFEKSQNNKYLEREKFLDAGLDVRWDGNSANMHHKVFIIDSKTVVTGSFNPTKNGDTKNDENLLIIHDPVVAAKYIEEFEMVWAAAGE
jgi:phosphatidylserine/phosphatidylglycerophosphate/cardiolipin synthase-like enzyme